MKYKALCVSAAICTFLASRVGQAQDVDVPGNLTMRNSTDTEGNILKGEAHSFTISALTIPSSDSARGTSR